MTPKPLSNNLDLLRAKVDMSGECWIWTGCKDAKGYGSARYQGKNWRVHRLAYFLEYGSLPPDMLVCHRCDTPACVNPKHLFLGTYLDNNRDRTAKGRGATKANGRFRGSSPEQKLRGEAHALSKLKDREVVEIKQMLANGMSQRPIAKRFNVHQVTISKIASGKHWRHVK